MKLRLGLYELAAAHRLDKESLNRLEGLAGLKEAPTGLARGLARGVSVLAAALAGFGILLWIAANWETFGRFGRFALLQGFILVVCVGALLRPSARAPLGLLALMGLGGLFAYFGQTYQTGADPWQLFAVWAAVGLPLCFAARSDVVWAPWTLVAMTGIALWSHAHTGHQWRVTPGDLPVQSIAWGAAVVVTAVLAPGARRITGAGVWAMRVAVVQAVAMVTVSALGGLFQSTVAPHYWVGLLVLGSAMAPFAVRSGFDVFALSVLALGLNALLVCGLGRSLFASTGGGEYIGSFFLLGLSAAGLLAASVSGILRLSKHYEKGASI